MKDNVYWVLELSIKDGEFDNFRKLMGEMINGTRDNEPGALNYEWTISEDNKNCHIYERYADSAATLTHLATFGEKYAERFLAALEPTRLVVYGNPNDELKEALAGFGPAYMSPLGGFVR